MVKEYIKEINAYWEGRLSCVGNPCGEFTNKKGEIIAYSSYDYISSITNKANKKQKQYFKKHTEKKQKQRRLKKALKRRKK